MTDYEPRKTKDNHPIDVKQAISAYAQSEKVKSGLIWICHVSDLVAAMDVALSGDVWAAYDGGQIRIRRGGIWSSLNPSPLGK